MLDLALVDGSLLLAAIVDVSEHGDDARVQRLLRFLADELGCEAAPTPACTPAELADRVGEGPARTAALQRLLLAAMLVPPLTAARLRRLDAYADALGCRDEPALDDLHKLLAGHHRRLSATLMRRFPPSERVRVAWRRGPLAMRWHIVKATLKLPDAATARRYAALAELPEGTLGRAFVQHCRSNGFALPGERGGLPDPVAFHDMGHALVGKTTSIDDEVYMGGFEAGCMRERGFTMLEFALLLFNLGARLPTDARPAVGAVDVEILLQAYADGRRATLDVIGWDFWQDVAEPLTQLRARYGIGG